MSEMVAKPSAHAERTVSFLQPNGSEVPFRVFSSQEVYDREQERIFRGATWSFLGLEAEIPNVYDFDLPPFAVPFITRKSGVARLVDLDLGGR
ncbi:hypothetical protein [Pseudomonas sp. DCA-1]|uniref:hypothetical protein n=1 Tax=Pseudomonas sp. DCA-1 TaxID=3344874 RepID=UPI003977D4F3